MWVKNNRIKKWVFKGSPAQPYYFGMVLVLQEAHKHAESDTQISFVFDRQEMLRGHAVKAFDDLVTDYEREGDYRFGGGISYRSSVREPPLQAADLLTHAWYEYQTRGTLSWERSEAMRQLTQNGEGMYIHDADSLQRVLAKLPPETLADIQAFEERARRPKK